MLRSFTKPVVDLALNRRTAILAIIYALIISSSLYLAYEIRFDFIVPELHQTERIRVLPLAIGIKLIALIAARQLGSMMTYFSIPDLIRIVWAMAGSSTVLFLLRFTDAPGFSAPRGVLLIDLMLCMGGLCVGRLATRLYRERLSGTRRSTQGVQKQQQRIAVIGAGDVGAALAKEFLSSPSRGFRPVMFFDDDPEKHGKLIHGIPVIGRPEAMESAKDIGSLAQAVIAMPSASAKRLREVILLCAHQGLKVETLPSMEELASGKVKASRVRPVGVQDLLGREAVDLDSGGIKHALEGRVIMVTGAGGSIGGELCRQIAALNPKRLLLVEQAEGALFTIEQELNELGLGGAGLAVYLVADILDQPRMEYIFARYHPEVIFHAAAHKHVYLMERQPAEAIRNNAIGTRQLAEIAAAHGCGAFVLISTDKAINPTDVMGATKRLAELQIMAIAASQTSGEDQRPKTKDQGLASASHVADQRPETKDKGRQMPARSEVEPFQQAQVPEPVEGRVDPHAAVSPSDLRPQSSVLGPPGSQPSTPDSQLTSSRSATKFMAVRFGNVLNSSGSVIPIFKRQIANGGPVTVTHPDVTRYFMTIPEAVGLVLQSFVLGNGGEIFVLDMGQPVKIVDLAKQMIELSGFRLGEDIEITFTGLKPGEKLFEELQHHTEEYGATAHPRIMRFQGRARVDATDLRDLEAQLHQLDSNQLKSALKRLVPEYAPFLD